MSGVVTQNRDEDPTQEYGNCKSDTSVITDRESPGVCSVGPSPLPLTTSAPVMWVQVAVRGVFIHTLTGSGSNCL